MKHPQKTAKYSVTVKHPGTEAPFMKYGFDRKKDCLTRATILAAGYKHDEVYMEMNGKVRDGLAVRWRYDRVSHDWVVCAVKGVQPVLF